jgi:isopenicillin N synthase-like dioxygenase
MPATEHLDQNAASHKLDRARIPNIDLAGLFGEARAADDDLTCQVRNACGDPGFFYVHNSCVEDRTIEAALHASKMFFDSPDGGTLKQSVHNRNAGGMKGWGPMFSEPAYKKDTIAHVESFDIGQQLSAESYRSLAIEPNIWPELAGFREAILDYYESITLLGRALCGVFSRILGEEPGFLNSRSGESAPRTMRLLHYPPNQGHTEPGKVGIAAHTDFECFTIMHQTAAGLELTDTKGNWRQAPADIGTFTIILGDMMERFSNGHLKATGHRVINTPWTRYSMVLFFAVDGNYSVKPLQQFVSADNPARYSAVTQDDHIARELRRAAANSERKVPLSAND